VFFESCYQSFMYIGELILKKYYGSLQMKLYIKYRKVIYASALYYCFSEFLHFFKWLSFIYFENSYIPYIR
jgi:hypothetical protein